MPPDYNSDDEKFDFQVGPPDQHDVYDDRGP
jgi:hypothetical protein